MSTIRKRILWNYRRNTRIENSRLGLIESVHGDTGKCNIPHSPPCTGFLSFLILFFNIIPQKITTLYLCWAYPILILVYNFYNWSKSKKGITKCVTFLLFSDSYFIVHESLALRHTEKHYNILIERRRSLWYASRVRASTSFTCTSSLERTEQNFIMKFTLRPLAGGIREKQIYPKL